MSNRRNRTRFSKAWELRLDSDKLSGFFYVQKYNLIYGYKGWFRRYSEERICLAKYRFFKSPRQGNPLIPQITKNKRRRNYSKKNKTICLQFQGKRTREKFNRQRNSEKWTDDNGLCNSVNYRQADYRDRKQWRDFSRTKTARQQPKPSRQKQL